MEKLKNCDPFLPETVLKIKKIFQTLCYENSLIIHFSHPSKEAVFWLSYEDSCRDCLCEFESFTMGEALAKSLSRWINTFLHSALG